MRLADLKWEARPAGYNNHRIAHIAKPKKFAMIWHRRAGHYRVCIQSEPDWEVIFNAYNLDELELQALLFHYLGE